MENPFNARWTGSYPTLCFGKWEIDYKGKRLKLPKEVECEHMNTYGSYPRWLFDSNWNQKTHYYVDGLHFDEWFAINSNWLLNTLREVGAPIDEQTLEHFYEVVQSRDWRNGSCGGCL